MKENVSSSIIAIERTVSKRYLEVLSSYANWYDQAWYAPSGERVRKTNEDHQNNRNLPLQSLVYYRPPPLHNIPSLKKITAHRKREDKKNTLFWTNSRRAVLICLMDVDADDAGAASSLSEYLVTNHLAGQGYLEPSPGNTGRHVYFKLDTGNREAGEVVKGVLRWQKLIGEDPVVAGWVSARFCCLRGEPTVWERTSDVSWRIERRGSVLKAPYFPDFEANIQKFQQLKPIPLVQLQMRMDESITHHSVPAFATCISTTTNKNKPVFHSSTNIDQDISDSSTSNPDFSNNTNLSNYFLPPSSSFQNILVINPETISGGKHRQNMDLKAGHICANKTSEKPQSEPKGKTTGGCTARRMTAAWQFVKDEGYIPEPDELLRYIHDNDLYSPPWSHNENKRRQDVGVILQKIANHHQPSKSRRNYNDFAKKLLHGHRLTYGKKGVIHWEDMSILLSILEECIIHKPNPDGSVPRDRIESLWENNARRKHFRRKWSDPKYPVMREFLCGSGVLEMVDDQWSTGKAMRYTIGPAHPDYGKVERILLTPIDPALRYDGYAVAERYCNV